MSQPIYTVLLTVPVLVGGPDNDTLAGGSGTDYCRGSAGTDTYFDCDTADP